VLVVVVYMRIRNKKRNAYDAAGPPMTETMNALPDDGEVG
jgi:hypothetical protein